MSAGGATKLPRGGSRSSKLGFERALAMLARLVQADATRDELIAHVQQAVVGAYETSPVDSFARDLRLLRSLGFPVRYRRSQGRYHLASFDHPVLQLHLSRPALEALALLKATFQGLPHEERVGALLRELESRLPQEAKLRLGRAPHPHLAMDPADPWQERKENLVAVERAIGRHQLLEFLYRSPKRPETERPKRHRVEPYNLEYREGHLYFDGYNLKTGRVYPYRVDRIVPGSAQVLPDTFNPRDGIARSIQIRYWLAPEIARYGASVRFRNHQESRQEDGSVVVTCEAGSLFEAVRKLLRYGSGCRVLAPPELVEKMRAEAHRLTARYGERPECKGVHLRIAHTLPSPSERWQAC
ncbi:MAG: helix-turn-helix transcriptional regulator [Candidatus Bipolaricaulaceae bacterium]